jgi:MFS family permease
MLGMGAFYATRAGFSPARVALFMGAPMAGGVILQWPVGSLSDRFPRRAVMMAVATSAALVAGGLLAVNDGGAVVILGMFVLGGLSFPLYSLGIAYTNDWIEPDQATGASAALVTMNGVGATLGPLLAAGMILTLGNRSFFLSLVVAHATIAAYLGWRTVFRDALPRSRQGPFVVVPARASSMAMTMVTVGRRRQRPESGEADPARRSEGRGAASGRRRWR